MMRIRHIQALKLLNPRKGDAESLKKYAIEARSHLFDLSQLGRDIGGEIIDIVATKVVSIDGVQCV